jgi:hypothetical protein
MTWYLRGGYDDDTRIKYSVVSWQWLTNIMHNRKNGIFQEQNILNYSPSPDFPIFSRLPLMPNTRIPPFPTSW